MDHALWHVLALEAFRVEGLKKNALLLGVAFGWGGSASTVNQRGRRRWFSNVEVWGRAQYPIPRASMPVDLFRERQSFSAHPLREARADAKMGAASGGVQRLGNEWFLWPCGPRVHVALAGS